MDHSKLVCGSGVAYVCTSKVVSSLSSSSASNSLDEDAPIISYLQDVPISCGNSSVGARTFWDCGSNRVLVNEDFAEELSLPGRGTSITMNVAGGGKKRLEAKIFNFQMLDRFGNKYPLWGYGVKTIIEADEPVDPYPVRRLFPHVPEAVFKKLQKKRIDLLIGLNFNNLFPTGGEGKNCVGNLKVLRTKFGDTGFILGGTHPCLRPPSPKFSVTAAEIRTARVEISPDVTVTPISDQVKEVMEVRAARVGIERELTVEHWESDNLGVEPPRRCRKCLQCADRGDCSEKHISHSIKEDLELKLIEDNVKVENGRVEVRYQFLKDPADCFRNNRHEVVRIEEKLWRSLQNNGLLETYHIEMQKYIDRGTFVRLDASEMSDYTGAVNYITHHGVLKDSASTPLRVVTNSS